MNDAIAKATAYEVMNTAHLAVFRAYLTKVKAREDMAVKNGMPWLRAFEAVKHAGIAYDEARKTWEAAVEAFIEQARHSA
jgi:hypothetical protein